MKQYLLEPYTVVTYRQGLYLFARDVMQISSRPLPLIDFRDFEDSRIHTKYQRITTQKMFSNMLLVLSVVHPRKYD